MRNSLLAAAAIAAVLMLGASTDKAAAMMGASPTQLGLANPDNSLVQKAALVCNRWGCRRVWARHWARGWGRGWGRPWARPWIGPRVGLAAEPGSDRVRSTPSRARVSVSAGPVPAGAGLIPAGLVPVGVGPTPPGLIPVRAGVGAAGAGVGPGAGIAGKPDHDGKNLRRSLIFSKSRSGSACFNGPALCAAAPARPAPRYAGRNRRCR